MVPSPQSLAGDSAAMNCPKLDDQSRRPIRRYRLSREKRKIISTVLYRALSSFNRFNGFDEFDGLASDSDDLW